MPRAARRMSEETSLAAAKRFAERKGVVEVMHGTVPGRVRFRVRGLYKSPSVKWLIEMTLRNVAGVTRAEANTTTGAVLVTFDPKRLANDAIARGIEDALVRAMARAMAGERLEAPSAKGKALRAPDSATDLACPRGSVKGNVRPIAPDTGEKPWHAYDADEVVAMLGSSATRGLDAAGVQRSAQAHGTNAMPRAEKPSALKRLVGQFNSLPVGLLTGAALLSFATGGGADALLILGVIALNGGIGFVTESHAETIITSLTRSEEGFATVIRGGKRLEIPEAELVVGDVVLLGIGRVPADARLIEAKFLSVDESALTGESLPVHKTTAAVSGAWVPLAERGNMVFRGTIIVGGSGLGVVVATGAQAEIGKVHLLSTTARAPQTPMQKNLDELGNQSVMLACAICGGVFVVGTLRGIGWARMLKSAVSLAIAAVPEGLPTIGTTTLAFGVRRMSRRNLLIRKLDAIEALGALEYLCLDKTGTVTQNKMVVQEVCLGHKPFQWHDGAFRVKGVVVPREGQGDLRKLVAVATLCSEARPRVEESGETRIEGSPTEGAIVQMAMDMGMDVTAVDRAYPRNKIRYRTEEFHFMYTTHARPEGGTLVAVKGSPGQVLKRCRWHLVDGEKVELTPTTRAALLAQNEKMAGCALRILAVACRETAEADAGLEDDLVWLGLIGLKDPPREGIRDVITAFHRAGIHTTMMTGDQEATAVAIGKELGFNGDYGLRAMDARKLEGLDTADFEALSRDVQVFSRVSPSDKLKIVQVLQSMGKVVAMTGDGINDSPALKAADVGIAMGLNGTEAAREAADAVILDDDLRSILAAVSHGRTIRANLRKSLRYLLATNMSEILTMFVSLAAGWGEALMPKQLLWINLVTDVFPALALALEPPEAGVMNRPPDDPGAPLFDRREKTGILAESAFLTFGTLAAYQRARLRHGDGARANTVAFLSLTGAQMLHTWSARSQQHSIFTDGGQSANRDIYGAMAFGFLAQAAAIAVPPLRQGLGVTTIDADDAVSACVGAALPFLAVEGSKAWRKSRARDAPFAAT